MVDPAELREVHHRHWRETWRRHSVARPERSTPGAVAVNCPVAGKDTFRKAAAVDELGAGGEPCQRRDPLAGIAGPVDAAALAPSAWTVSYSKRVTTRVRSVAPSHG